MYNEPSMVTCILALGAKGQEDLHKSEEICLVYTVPDQQELCSEHCLRNKTAIKLGKQRVSGPIYPKFEPEPVKMLAENQYF